MKQLSLEYHNKLLQLVSHYESLHDGDLTEIGLQPKMCPAGLWTEGYGRLVRDSEGNTLKGINNKKKAYDNSKIHTIEQAHKALEEDLSDYSERIDSLQLQLTDNQKVALISFCYNVGFYAFKKSKFLEHVKRKAKPALIDICFRSFNKSNGVELKGLTYRRKTEALMYITGELKYFNI